MIYQDGELTLTDHQRVQVNDYLRLTGRPASEMECMERVRLVLGIIEAFNNDAQIAAERYNRACEVADKAMAVHSIKMTQHLPHPNRSFLQRFDCVNEGKAYWEKVEEESLKVYWETYQREFYGLVEQYHERQISGIHSIQ